MLSKNDNNMQNPMSHERAMLRGAIRCPSIKEREVERERERIVINVNQYTPARVSNLSINRIGRVLSSSFSCRSVYPCVQSSRSSRLHSPRVLFVSCRSSSNDAALAHAARLLFPAQFPHSVFVVCCPDASVSLIADQHRRARGRFKYHIDSLVEQC